MQNSLSPEITTILEAINSNYQSIGRSDRWSLEVNPYEPYGIYNPLYFGGCAYEGTPDELKTYANKLYERHFGVPFSPDTPAPANIAPFFGKIEYLRSKGTVDECVLFTDEVKYLNACMDRFEYGVPLRATRITENEYNTLMEELGNEQEDPEQADSYECGYPPLDDEDDLEL